MNTQRNFRVSSGTGPRDAQPVELPHATFGEFVHNFLGNPVVCHLTSDAYAALTPAEQKVAKATQYFTSSVFGGDGRRNVRNVTACSLVVLDVDDAPSARALLEAPLDELLPWNFALWTTLTSTAAAPRVRLAVESIPLSAAEYRAAVTSLAARLGVDSYDPVSTDPAHLWYRPTVFADKTDVTPMVVSRITGPAYAPQAPEEDLEQAEGAIPVATASDITLQDVEAMLSHLDPDNPPYWGWVKPLMALRHQFGASEAAFTVFDAWSSKGTKYPGSEATRKKWDSFRPAPNDTDPVTIRTLIAAARKEGWVATGSASMSALEARITEAASMSELLGPVLREVHASAMISPIELAALLAAMQTRSKSLKAPLKLADLRTALAALDTRTDGAAVIPAALQGFVFVREDNQWFHQVRKSRIMPAAFDLGYATEIPEDAGRPSHYALRRLMLPSVDRRVYDPRRPTDLIYTDDTGSVVLNTYRQSFPEANPDQADEAAQILNEHFELLFPDPHSRDLLRSWMGWCLRNPGEKCKWHVFIQGAHGCGKSLLAEAMAVVVGPTNSRKVSSTMLVEKFNAWAVDVCFAYFEEVLIGDRQRDTMETIKDLVTGATTNIRAMYSDAAEKPNYLNGMFLSNHHHGLRLERSDRRFFCLCAAQQTKEQVQEIPLEYFVRLARLKGDLAGGLRHYLLTCPLDNDFNPQSHAPHTADRDIVMRAGANEVDAAVTQVIESDEHPLIGKDIVCSGELFNAVRGEVRGATTKQVSRVLTDMGYVKVGQRLLSDGSHPVLWYHPGHIAKGLTPTQVANARLAMEEIK